MIIPGVKDLTIIQGGTFDIYWVLSIDGTVVDLTGYTAELVVRQSVGDADAILTLSTENGGIIITPEDGKIQLYISSEDTRALSFRNAVYNLELTVSEVTNRLLQGNISVSFGTIL